MVNTREAVENVKSLARTFQSVIDLAAQLEAVADIDQRVAESRTTLMHVKQEVEDAQSMRDAAMAAKVNATNAAQVATARAQADAKAILDEAHALAQATEATAKERANAMVAEAMTQVEAMQNAVKDAQAKRDTAQQELADLEAKIERARAKMRDILGA